MANKFYVPYDEAVDLIEEADILLFRGTGWISNLIKKSGEGLYSHVGLATWHNGKRKDNTGESLLEIVEFREGKGGRTINLATGYHKYIRNRTIDVYRVNKTLNRLYYDSIGKQILSQAINFDAKGITNNMRILTGLPYGWNRIWWIMKRKMMGFRWFSDNEDMSDSDQSTDVHDVYPVCSTAVAASYAKFGYSLIPNKSTDIIEPSDLSRSALISYLFTLTA